jgi:aspartyl-tRNA synthetase
VFVTLRDHSGTLQLVVGGDGTEATELAQQAAALSIESVVHVRGTSRARPTAQVRDSRTGAIEVLVSRLSLLNACDPLPQSLQSLTASEEARLRWRFLDLRRAPMQLNLRRRALALQTARRVLEENGCLEVETPTLFRRTPEGAREFVVPSRRDRGTFYALVQSPQQYKQLLMASGIDRYYQIARCYRDEDLRADRQPEFTQIDIELSCAAPSDIFQLIESILCAVWRQVRGIELPQPFKRITFREAMERYGSDKPDTRYGFELCDLTRTFEQTTVKVLQNGGDPKRAVIGFAVPQLSALSLPDREALQNEAKLAGAIDGVLLLSFSKGTWKSPVAKFLSAEEKEQLNSKLQLKGDELVLIVCGPRNSTLQIAGRLRIYCANLLQQRGLLQLDANQFNFMWVVDFPLFTRDEETGQLVTTHHPFTAPVPEDIELLDSNPEAMRGQHYDCVVNGMELGGGSVRVHDGRLQEAIFRKGLGLNDEQIKRFQHLLTALKLGCPPHAGIALGFDRMASMLCDAKSLRDVIAFPKAASGRELLTGSPSPLSAAELAELGLCLLPTDK